MNRDELLTKLTMELGEWPCEPYGPRGEIKLPKQSLNFCADNGYCSFFDRQEYLQRRAELINKPSWHDAPSDCNWLAQDGDGHWGFWENEPETMSVKYGYPKDGWRGTGACAEFNYSNRRSLKGAIPTGHDWRETLERRPASEWPEDRMDVIGSNGPAGDHYMTEEEEEMPVKGRWSNPESLAEDLARIQAKHLSDTTPAESILAAARQHMLDRASTYDKPDGERSMGATVDAFRAVTGIDMTEEQGWLFMQLLKAVRSQQGDYRADSYEDGAAYVALAGEAAARDRKNQ